MIDLNVIRPIPIMTEMQRHVDVPLVASTEVYEVLVDTRYILEGRHEQVEAILIGHMEALGEAKTAVVNSLSPERAETFEFVAPLTMAEGVVTSLLIKIPGVDPARLNEVHVSPKPLTETDIAIMQNPDCPRAVRRTLKNYARMIVSDPRISFEDALYFYDGIIRDAQKRPDFDEEDHDISGIKVVKEIVDSLSAKPSYGTI